MDQLPRLGKRELAFLLLFTCSFVVSVLGRFLFLLVLGMDCAFLLWHSLGLPLIILPYFLETYTCRCKTKTSTKMTSDNEYNDRLSERHLIKIKFRSFKNKENIYKKKDGPYRGFRSQNLSVTFKI